MPTWMTNGTAATETALIVELAFSLTAAWFLANPEADSYQVGNQLSLFLVQELNAVGGNMTENPPFFIPNPAPYVTNWFTTGNCN